MILVFWIEFIGCLVRQVRRWEEDRKSVVFRECFFQVFFFGFRVKYFFIFFGDG